MLDDISFGIFLVKQKEKTTLSIYTCKALNDLEEPPCGGFAFYLHTAYTHTHKMHAHPRAKMTKNEKEKRKGEKKKKKKLPKQQFRTARLLKFNNKRVFHKNEGTCVNV